MLTFQQTIDVPISLFSGFGIPADKVLFFDIETTGLSADTSYLYLICAGFLSDGIPTIRQWFSETVEEEASLLTAFFQFLDAYSVLVHYNGTTFDIPYLEKKCLQYKLSYGFASVRSHDIYRYIHSVKKYLSLSGCRQKDIETILNIHREDTYDGGQLIEIYKQYLGRSRYDNLRHGTPLRVHTETGLPKLPKSPSEALLYLLLLHNAEDVSGLIRISCLMPLLQIITGSVVEYQSICFTNEELLATLPFSILSSSANSPSSSESKASVSISAERFLERFLQGQEQLPLPINCFLEYHAPNLILHIPYYIGELKYFFPEYKEYYYLPLEDCAIHKSVASGVDKAHRKQATASTCYIKKQGCFLPQTASLFQPSFLSDRKSSVSFFEVKQLSCHQDNFQMTQYINSLFAV